MHTARGRGACYCYSAVHYKCSEQSSVLLAVYCSSMQCSETHLALCCRYSDKIDGLAPLITDPPPTSFTTL